MSCQQSVASYLSDWLEIHSPGLAPSTVAGYKRSITLHIVPVCGTVPLAELSPLHILKALLGHAHLSTTADIYVHPSAAVRSAALASVARLVVQ